MTVHERSYSAGDLLALPESTSRYLLLEGQLIEMSPTGRSHGLITNRIAYLITGYVLEHRLGAVYAAESGFQLSTNPDTVFGIDVAFVASDRIQTGEGFFEGAPDLAVEVVSPGNRGPELHVKVARYFGAGTRLVWVVYPQSRVVYVYRAPNEIEVLEESDNLSGDPVLPGFSIKVAEIFAILDR